MPKAYLRRHAHTQKHMMNIHLHNLCCSYVFDCIQMNEWPLTSHPPTKLMVYHFFIPGEQVKQDNVGLRSKTSLWLLWLSLRKFAWQKRGCAAAASVHVCHCRWTEGQSGFPICHLSDQLTSRSDISPHSGAMADTLIRPQTNTLS